VCNLNLHVKWKAILKLAPKNLFTSISQNFNAETCALPSVGRTANDTSVLHEWDYDAAISSLKVMCIISVHIQEVG
jgi:hypothetical protein